MHDTNYTRPALVDRAAVCTECGFIRRPTETRTIHACRLDARQHVQATGHVVTLRDTFERQLRPAS